MTKVLLVSGFLGSGKTTLIKSLAEYFSANNVKSALIINEIGEIGIDNKYMKRLGYNLWELFGGCICCTLASGLVDTMEQLKEYEPEVVMIEPSGGADPKTTIDALVDMDIERKDIVNFFLLDTTRLEMFMAVLQPLLQSSIHEADVVLINKTELIEENTFHEALRIVREIKPEVPTVKTRRDNLIDEEMAGLVNKFLTKEGD
ncbi:MAG: cobalamin biosynthesis protein P47K [Clostridia bacterium]|jgi:G3E family GTPase|nr:cobalamin biosynthesis protein P47K [Clostridia bacterium]